MLGDIVMTMHDIVAWTPWTVADIAVGLVIYVLMNPAEVEKRGAIIAGLSKSSARAERRGAGRYRPACPLPYSADGHPDMIARMVKGRRGDGAFAREAAYGGRLVPAPTAAAGRRWGWGGRHAGAALPQGRPAWAGARCACSRPAVPPGAYQGRPAARV